MPSKIEEWTPGQSLQSKMEGLMALSKQVNECIGQEQWEQLVEVLDFRQRRLEALFSDETTGSEALRSLANSILEQDAILLTRLQEQQRIVEKKIIELGKGQQAVQAYGAS
jgi:hypothetical protein